MDKMLLVKHKEIQIQKNIHRTKLDYYFRIRKSYKNHFYFDNYIFLRVYCQMSDR